MSVTSIQALRREVFTHPDEPGVHGAEHGAVRHDGFMDLGHVVHQPAKFHRAEVSADREPRLVLQDDNDKNNQQCYQKSAFVNQYQICGNKRLHTEMDRNEKRLDNSHFITKSKSTIRKRL